MDMTSLTKLITTYKARLTQCHYLEWYEQSENITEAIRRAALARTPKGTKHSHQRHIPKLILERFQRNLRAVEAELQNSNEFNSIYDLVKKQKVDGIGPLATYDTALRIGAYRRALPKMVYLHAGTRKGVKNLAKRFSDPGLMKASNGETILVGELPPPIGDLEPWEIEDFMCIYKNDF